MYKWKRKLLFSLLTMTLKLSLLTFVFFSIKQYPALYVIKHYIHSNITEYTAGHIYIYYRLECNCPVLNHSSITMGISSPFLQDTIARGYGPATCPVHEQSGHKDEAKAGRPGEWSGGMITIL